MAHRYSRAEKGKWKEDSTRSERRRPIQIPQTDNSALIEENKLTLIGRVTNPAVQKTQWVVEWLLQYWNVEGELTGRELGPELFQIRFPSEEALQTVLRKGPYHYKRWMILLQRWEPVVSDSFPRMIAFWIRIHGLPLHYWTEETLEAIGKGLGPRLGKDVDHGRIRILIDGLKNLEMHLPLQLPTGEEISVNLEYEKLEKHCFLCFSLCHEQETCPRNKDKADIKLAPQGISQRNTLRKLEDQRRKHDSRRPFSLSSRDRQLDPSELRRSQGSVYSRLQNSERARYYVEDNSNPLNSRERDRSRYGDSRRERDRSNERVRSSHHSFPSQRKSSPIKRTTRDRSPSQRDREDRRAHSRGHNSQYSRTPTPRPPRETMNLPTASVHEEANSRSRDRVPALERLEIDQTAEPQRVSALDRLEEMPEQEPRRVSALERLEAPLIDPPPRQTGLSNSLLARLQDVEIQYAGEEHQSPQFGEGSGRRILETPEVLTHQESPRIPATLRIGSASGGPASTGRKKIPPKSATKRIVKPKPPAKRKPPVKITGATNTRAIRSPIQGTRLSKQITTRTRSVARKRLCVERNGQSQSLPLNKDDNTNVGSLGAGTSRKKVDFQNPSHQIP
ncbi:Zinc knuckle CX2CX4HX4C protein [Raphanus sativus]|nr:Zinc knuckle CX2CX4HX4C protein [Raphanus sativus]KAJ4915606.1 Zinc knuckle CX2CX4HX4C protein [Raphanus sativus]